ncbi:MAG: hypothetical protein AB1749_06715 [Pseudomonadota bacterium]
MDTTIFVGLDVHKKTIAVATVEARVSADVRFYGTIPNTPEAIRSMLRKLAKGGQRKLWGRNTRSFGDEALGTQYAIRPPFNSAGAALCACAG